MYVNKVIVEGRAGRDANVREAGTSLVANTSIAVTERFVGRDGTAKEITNWVPVTAWNELANELARARKGDRVFVEGSIVSRSYEKDGNKVNVVEVKASFVQVLAAHGFEGNESAPRDAAPPRDRAAVRPMRTSRPPAPSGGGGGRPPVDDDEPLPF